MSRFLKIVLITEVGLGAFWTLTIASVPGRGDFGHLPLFLFVYFMLALGLLIGAWAFWRHPQERRKAAWAIGIPIAFCFLPGIVKKAFGGHVSQAEMLAIVAIVVAAIFIATLVAPRRVANVLPGFLFRSRFINWLPILSMLAGWLFLVGIVVWLVSGQGGGYQGDTGYGAGVAIVIAALYLVGMGAASILSAAWAWLGLRGRVEGARRKLHIAQMALAVPGILVGVTVAAWLLQQMQ